MAQLKKKDAHDDAEQGIVEFEKTLERAGKDSKSSSAGSSTKTDSLGIIVNAPDEDEAKKLMQKDAQMYISKIKSKKMEETVARKDREQRRRKIMIDQQKVFQEIEEKRKNELMIQKLLKQSIVEQKLAKEFVFVEYVSNM